MWYLIYAEDIPNSNEVRAKARPAHIARLKELIAIIAKFNSLAEAEAWAADDPYWHQGVYQKGTGIVKPFKITAKMNGASF